MISCIKYCFIFLFLFSSVCHSTPGWESEIDKQYMNLNYKLYTKNNKAKDLMSNWGGDSKRLKKAAELLNEVVTEDPLFAPAYVQIARFYSRAGMLPNNKIKKDALIAMEKVLFTALEIEPNYGYAHAMMALTKTKQMNLNEAESSITKAEKSGTTYPYLKSLKSDLLLKQKRYKEAVKVATSGFNDYINQPHIATGYIDTTISALRKIRGSESDDQEEYWHKKNIEIRPTAWAHGNYSNFLFYSRQDFTESLKYAEKAIAIRDYPVARIMQSLSHYAIWYELDKSPETKEQARLHLMNAKDAYGNTEAILKKINSKKFLRLHVKIFNYDLQIKNSKRALDKGRITQKKYEEILAGYHVR